jgi:hypothetical protein
MVASMSARLPDEPVDEQAQADQRRERSRQRQVDPGDDDLIEEQQQVVERQPE